MQREAHCLFAMACPPVDLSLVASRHGKRRMTCILIVNEPDRHRRETKFLQLPKDVISDLCMSQIDTGRDVKPLGLRGSPRCSYRRGAITGLVSRREGGLFSSSTERFAMRNANRRSLWKRKPLQEKDSMCGSVSPSSDVTQTQIMQTPSSFPDSQGLKTPFTVLVGGS